MKKFIIILLLVSGSLTASILEENTTSPPLKVSLTLIALTFIGVGIGLTVKYIKEGEKMGGYDNGGTTGVTGFKYKLNVQELLQDKLLQIYKYRFGKNQNTSPIDWKTNAEDLITEAKKNYSLTDNHPKDEELINELAWILWEASEKIGEFAGKSEERAKETISNTSREMAIRIETEYTKKLSELPSSSAPLDSGPMGSFGNVWIK